MKPIAYVLGLWLCLAIGDMAELQSSRNANPEPPTHVISTGKVVMASPPSALDYTAQDGMSQTNAPKVLESVKAAAPQPTFTDGVRIATVMARRNPDVIDLRSMWQMCYQVWQMEQQQAAKGAK